MGLIFILLPLGSRMDEHAAREKRLKRKRELLEDRRKLPIFSGLLCCPCLCLCRCVVRADEGDGLLQPRTRSSRRSNAIRPSSSWERREAERRHVRGTSEDARKDKQSNRTDTIQQRSRSLSFSGCSRGPRPRQRPRRSPRGRLILVASGSPSHVVSPRSP